jgi:hypothetical protein
MSPYNELFCAFVNEEDIEQDKTFPGSGRFEVFYLVPVSNWFLAWLFFDLEDGSGMIFRIVG